MKEKRPDLTTESLIDQIIWLLERMTRGQIMRVFSVANRLYCTEPQNGALQKGKSGSNGSEQEKLCPKGKARQRV